MPQRRPGETKCRFPRGIGNGAEGEGKNTKAQRDSSLRDGASRGTGRRKMRAATPIRNDCVLLVAAMIGSIGLPALLGRLNGDGRLVRRMRRAMRIARWRRIKKSRAFGMVVFPVATMVEALGWLAPLEAAAKD